MIKYLTFLTVIFGVFGEREICSFVSGTVRSCGEGEYCCGDKCCTPLAVWKVVLIVIGCIITLSLVVYRIFLCVKKDNRREGRVIHPRRGANVTVVSVRSSHGYNPPRNGYNQYPTPPIRGKAACQNVPSSPNNEPTTYNKLRRQANAIVENSRAEDESRIEKH